MKANQVASTALLCLATAAHATIPPAGEGLSFPDFDDPTAPSLFYLDSSGIYPEAGYFSGNVGQPGDDSDTIHLRWNLPAGSSQIAARFEASGWVTAGAFNQERGVNLYIADAQTGEGLLSIDLDGRQPSYIDSALVFSNHEYLMRLTPRGLGNLGPDVFATYSIALEPVPEPSGLLMLAAGLGALLLRRAARRGLRS